MPRASGVKEKSKQRLSFPTGTVTFLFTDIEGSTQRWETHQRAMHAAVKRHDHLMRSAIERHGGYVFKTVGDAFCAAFHNTPGAVAAALDAQRAINKEDFSAIAGLPVRMGLHTGRAHERDADYFGPTVNRVARLMSVGHGGQVLLSGVTKDLVCDELPDGTSLIDLGSHRLKDLAQAEQIWQLAAADLPSGFPPLNSLDARPNNLPVQLTNLLGREVDLERVKSLFSEHRLLTLSGAGGVGKTRMALQIGADLIDHYRDGVWFADLAPLSDPALVTSVVAKVLGISAPDGASVSESIPPWLRRKRLLLIFDNCEHLLGAVAELADAILKNAPDVRILATSRQALDIHGEVVYLLPSLAVPEKPEGLELPEALKYGAIALFVERAKAADNRFALTDDSAPIVADICRRLDGIPLAIELAAARVKVLSIPNLAQRLNERFKILTGGSRTALPRQKTLVALIDWSYDLLSEQEQTLFNRLGIFAGGFSLDAVIAACAGDGIDEIDILDLLSSLSDKSLIVADTGKEQERYRLLESTRAYALEKLAAANERDRLACRHAAYFREEAQDADIRYGTGSTAAWLADAELDLDNYRAMLEWALTDGHDVVVGGAVAGALGRLWSNGGFTAEGRYWIDRAQAGLDESAHPKVAARLWRALAQLSDAKRSYDCAQRSLVLYQATGDRHGVGLAHLAMGFGLYQMGRLEEARQANACALAALRECGDERGLAVCLTHRAIIHRHCGNIDAGRETYAQALEAYKALRNESGVATVLLDLADLEFADGQVERALQLVSESLQITALGKNATYVACANNNIAAYSIALGNFDRAREAAREGLRWARKGQYGLGFAVALQHLALLAALYRQVHTAARLSGYVDAQFEELGSDREPTEKSEQDKLLASLRDQLSNAELEKLTAEGAAWSEEQAVEEALKVQVESSKSTTR
ncbi:MAG: tetratricopeptide repeat protein [Candidatus Eremiobacteraeota bacterium]|nr:tetratricopeptide repeat protein [Candidatus Eremiobacteraeota bacterium]